jgi:hypothetical protein
MVIAVSIFPDLEFNIVVEFAYQNERCLTKNHDQMVMYIWPSCDPDDTLLYNAICQLPTTKVVGGIALPNNDTFIIDANPYKGNA